MAWFSPRHHPLFLEEFSAGKGFLPATGRTLSFQRAVPEGTLASVPQFLGRFKAERLHPPPEEIVPFLSGVLARGFNLPLGCFSPFECPAGREVVRQHAKPRLDPHPL